MDHGYFNYDTHIAGGRWERRQFIRRWWQIYAPDRRWTPPAYARVVHLLQPGNDPYLDRANPLLISLDALPGTRRPTQAGSFAPGTAAATFEQPVAATVVLTDPRAGDTAYLALLHCVNDEDSLDRLLGAAMEQLWSQGIHRVIGPTGLSPHLCGGVLHNRFDLVPPVNTPYNPPYLPDLVAAVLEPLRTSRLFHVTVPVEALPMETHGITVRQVDPWRLSQDLLPLLVAACSEHEDFPPPDENEAACLLRWLTMWPLRCWVAEADGAPVGFVLMQPDSGAAIRRAGGGRNPLWRLWLTWRTHRSAPVGQVPFGGVLPAWRRRGIGRALWHQLLHEARTHGWPTLTIGPVMDGASGAAFLAAAGASPRQEYILYQNEI